MQLIPSYSPVNTPTSVTVVGGPFDIVGLFECSVNGVLSAAVIQGTNNITCTITSSTIGIFDLQVFFNGELYTQQGLPLEFYGITTCYLKNNQFFFRL